MKRSNEKMMKKKTRRDETGNCFSWISECPVAGCTVPSKIWTLYAWKR
jgi:hypothetical protein